MTTAVRQKKPSQLALPLLLDVHDMQTHRIHSRIPQNNTTKRRKGEKIFSQMLIVLSCLAMTCKHEVNYVHLIPSKTLQASLHCVVYFSTQNLLSSRL